MAMPLSFTLDRRSPSSLSEQVRRSIEAAILAGQLSPGARLPSWRALASQLGVARGTVRVAYERLADAQLIVSAGPAGTRVSEHLPRAPRAAALPAPDDPFLAIGLTSPSAPPRLFQLGVPAEDAFPVKTWSRILVRAARTAALAPLSYPDPRGEPILRRQIAAYLAVSRAFACSEEQIFITNGFTGALGLVIRALSLEGKSGWVENPGYPLARTALNLSGVKAVAVPVDSEGLDVAAGISLAPDAAFAVVTPGQQAPLGMTMSLHRRRALIDWAEAANAFIIEDDYLGELQLKGRAAPAMASLDTDGRILHIGTFSKTISPALRLGFVVVPAGLVPRFLRVTACLAPAPAATTQMAVAAFIADGHLLRHLRKARRLYAERRDILKSLLGSSASEQMAGGLALLLPIPDDAPDTEIARQAAEAGLAPSPLSRWYAGPDGGTSLPPARYGDHLKWAMST